MPYVMSPIMAFFGIDTSNRCSNRLSVFSSGNGACISMTSRKAGNRIFEALLTLVTSA